MNSTKENDMSKAQFLKDNLRPGEVYAGLLLGQNGEKDYHLILLPQTVPSTTWQKAKAWAKGVGGSLPDRRELRLLWVNAKQQFEDAWYWSSETHASDSDYAWMQFFDYGFQSSGRKVSSYRARAVRRLAI